MIRKTDNYNLKAKLGLRRAMLAKMPAGPISVCDCFSGNEILWSTLRLEFDVDEYIALDVKVKDRRLKLDSLRYLQNQKWNHNVVDLDAYGSPWAHWHEVLRRGGDCLVFITVGSTMFHMQSKFGLASIGITFDVPAGMHSQIKDLVTDGMLGMALQDFKVLSAMEAENPNGNARYIGLMLKRKLTQ